MSLRPALGLAAFAVASATLASGARAQETSSPGAAFALPFGPVPKEIFGVPCEARPGDAEFAPSLKCNGKDALKEPGISVAVSDLPTRPTRADLIARERKAFQYRPIFNIIREEDFTPPGDPGAIGFRALYQTDFGNRYVWAVHSRGKLIRVLVLVFSPMDFAAMTADVEAKVFGLPPAPAAAWKDK
ncbi:MAG TPA: hypothetical protein VFQ67_14020 [Allosphingosinicella sp.]|jgi:hypothetical protein|nr:hypothetical protein [Allosphingosinicella sp.]